MRFTAIILATFICSHVLGDTSNSLVPVTGQEKCFDLYGAEISCAGTGQDGDYQSGRSNDDRFVDNGDGTVTDLFTNLIWTKTVNCLDFVNWQQALDYANSLQDGMCGLSDGSMQGDWRLPNILELQSLIGRKTQQGSKYLNFPANHPFVIDPSSNYWTWSSSNHPNTPVYAHAGVLFGGMSGLLKTRNDLAGSWAVRTAAVDDSCSVDGLSDDDCDSVPNAHDQCLDTSDGQEVDDSGCSLDQTCDCGAAKNHGQYVSCVAGFANKLTSLSLLDSSDAKDLKQGAAKSSCGK